MPRFVLLYHELPPHSGRSSHYDLMLERDGALRTWALEQEPQPGRETRATALADHRLAYLDYEGPVSNERGEVTRCDRGEYTSLDEAAGEWRVRLSGERFRGVLLLKRAADTAANSAEEPAQEGAAAHSWVVRLLPESDA